MSQRPFDALILAPMAGVTDAVFRWLCHEQGARLCHTEMISAKGYVMSGGGNRQAQALLLVLPGSGDTVAQLFGKEPEYFAEAAQRLLAAHDFCGIDINMGCPAPKIANGGEGSALMRTPELAGRIIRATVDAVRVPVTVKMRLGWDEDSINAVDFAKMAEESGASALCVHGRTRRQFYAGSANWAAIGRVKRAVSIPVYASGDVFSAKHAMEIRERTGCDGLMVARGATGNPWIFRQIEEALAGLPQTGVTARMRIGMAQRHAEMQIVQQGEWLGIREMRKHVAWYLKGLKDAARVRGSINQIETMDALRDCLYAYLGTLEEDAPCAPPIA